VTTFFIRYGLQTLGIPAYIDGYVIEIPQGSFFVAEACAGLRFLIASIAFGCLYALLMYRSPVRRLVFIAVSIVVPIVANGFRGLGIVYLGYLLGSAEAAATDHIIYGWLFFSAIILLLIALGLPFRQDGIPARPNRSETVAAPSYSLRAAFAATAGLFAIAAIGPLLAAGLARAAAAPLSPPSRIAVGSACSVQAAETPDGAGAEVRSQLVACVGLPPMMMRWAAFAPRSTAAPVMAQRRRMVAQALTEGLSESWLEACDGTQSAWRVLRSNDPAYVIAAAVWIDGGAIRPGLTMRLRMALNSLFGSAHLPLVVTVTPVANWQTRNAAELRAAESSVSRFLLAYPELERDVGAASALH
jgi:exosortase/archaeosortase family protein